MIYFFVSYPGEILSSSTSGAVQCSRKNCHPAKFGLDLTYALLRSGGEQHI
jgi:hypothetical protein